jgi:N-acetylmuramoyl-L-alanine amidase
MYLSQGSVVSGDAGHNCYPDTGAIGIRSEDECAKRIWELIQENLKNLGYKTKDCTPWDMTFNSIGSSQFYRVKEANESDSNLHISIHFNFGVGNGIECWVSKLGGRAEKFASQICDEISDLGFNNRGVKACDLYLTSYTNMTSIFINCCFIDSDQDMDIYNDEKMALAIIKGITGRVVEFHN